MKISQNYKTLVCLLFITSCLGLFSYSIISFLVEVRSLERLDEENKIDWQFSTHPKAELLRTIKNIFYSEEDDINDLLDKAFQMDPQNGFIDSLAIRNLIDDIGYFEEDSNKNIEYVYIENEEALIEAITHFENILTKPVYDGYHLDFYMEMRRFGQESYLGMVKDFAATTSIDYNKNLTHLYLFLKFYYVYNSPSDDELLERVTKMNHLSEKLTTKADSLTNFIFCVGLGIAPLNQVAKTHLKNPKFHSIIKSLSKFNNENLILPESNNKAYFSKLSNLAKITTPVTKIPDNYSQEIRNNRLLEYSFYESAVIEGAVGLIFLITLGLLLVLLRWKLSVVNETERLSINYRNLILPILFSIVLTLLYLLLRPHYWSKQFSSTEIIAKCIFISEMSSFFLLCTAFPIKAFLNSTNIVETKKIRNYLIFLPLSFPLILPWILPQSDTILLLVGLIPSAYILYYFVSSFRLLTKNEAIPWVRFKSKVILTYLCSYGLLLLFVYKPLIQASEAELYRTDKVTKVAIDMGYVCSYTEALTLEYAKQQLKKNEANSTAIDLDPDDSYKLILSPSAKEKRESELRRKRRGEILKAPVK